MGLELDWVSNARLEAESFQIEGKKPVLGFPPAPWSSFPVSFMDRLGSLWFFQPSSAALIEVRRAGADHKLFTAVAVEKG
jgi:hypothetical protein